MSHSGRYIRLLSRGTHSVQRLRSRSLKLARFLKKKLKLLDGIIDNVYGINDRGEYKLAKSKKVTHKNDILDIFL